MKTLRPAFFMLFVSLIILFAASCSPGGQQSPGPEDMRYLTPIPQATIDAYVEAGPITDRTQAVIAAQKSLLTTRLTFAEPPAVVFVGELTYKEAADWVSKTGEFTPGDVSDDTKVWLVVLEGASEVIPPGTSNNATPGPKTLGCTYVILDPGGHSTVTNHAGEACPGVK